MKLVIMNPAYRVTDAAYDRLMAVFKRHNMVFEHAHKWGGLRQLCRQCGINPDA